MVSATLIDVSRSKYGDAVPERVRFIFTRSLPVNDTEQAQIVRELHGIVPDEQLLPQLSFLRDFRPDASQR